MASRYRLPDCTPREPERKEITDLQRTILRTIHEHPEFVKAAPIAEYLGTESEFRVLNEIGALFAIGLLSVDREGYHLTPSGGLTLGVQLT